MRGDLLSHHAFEIKPKFPKIPKHRANTKHFSCPGRGTEGDTSSTCSTIAEAPFTLSLPRPAPAESWTKRTAGPLQDRCGSPLHSIGSGLP